MTTNRMTYETLRLKARDAGLNGPWQRIQGEHFQAIRYTSERQSRTGEQSITIEFWGYKIVLVSISLRFLQRVKYPYYKIGRMIDHPERAIWDRRSLLEG